MDHIDAPRPAPTAPRTETLPPLHEPATAQALWPTFMRRTLSEEDLRAARPPRLREN
jgi:hypothetical protein